MPDYEVTIREIEIYIVKVTADNEEQAESTAWEMLDDGGREAYFDDSDGESDAVEI